MFQASQQTLVRQSARNLNSRRFISRRTFERFQSTSSQSSTSQGAYSSYVGAGVAGGAVVAISGYTWYHFSGLKGVVQTSQSAKEYLQKAQQTVAEKAQNPNEALAYLRDVSKSYVAVIPGLSYYVDSTFDAFDKLAEKHGDEVNSIAKKGYEEIQAIVKQNGGKADLETATKIMGVLQKRGMEMQDLVRRSGGDAMESIWEKYPELKEKLGGGYQQFAEMVEKQGPEAKKIYDDTKNQVMEIFAKGFSPEALDQARSLIQSKTSEVGKISESAAQDAWSKGLEQARPYLDKLPEIKQLLEENASKFIAAGVAILPSGGDTGAKEVFDKLREVAESKGGAQKEKVQQLKELIQKKADEAEEKGKKGMENGWTSVVSAIKMIPGGSEALEKTPNVKDFVKFSQERGEDAKQLVKEAYEEILKVLEDKGKKAKKIAEQTKQDAEKRSQ